MARRAIDGIEWPPMTAKQRQRLARQRTREAVQRRAASLRPYAARRGIHGPRRFRTLFGAQGWVDANWPGGEPEIVESSTGARWRRNDGVWIREGGEPQPAHPVEAAEPPYWMRPL